MVPRGQVAVTTAPESNSSTPWMVVGVPTLIFLPVIGTSGVVTVRWDLALLVKAVTRFAFRSLGLHRVEAACCTDNDASARLLVKAGFQLEGRRRSFIRAANGEFLDDLVMARIS